MRHDDRTLADGVGTAVPDWFTMAAPYGHPTTWTILHKDDPNHLGLRFNVLPAHQMALITSGSVPFRFTPFHENGTFNPTAVLPMAELFKQKLGITAVWVMGMRGQFDTMTVAERKLVTTAWVAAGKATGLFTIIQCGSDVIADAAELAAFAESVGADAVASVGPYEELCTGAECVVDWVAPVAAAAPKTPFFYYHTPGWNGKSIDNVKMYDWFKFAETKIPTAVGVKFEVSRGLQLQSLWRITTAAVSWCGVGPCRATTTPSSSRPVGPMARRR